VSIKIDELMREIEKNSGNHKALIFSQFTTMLHLIENKLKQKGIKYYYLDGSTKAADRKDLVAGFQEKDEVRFFLISLKAGGVGLNLTAARKMWRICLSICA
jgi:non-specific serine/threonine protein kinase